MKYKFNTLEEVKTAIEQWFKDLGYDNSERAEKQYFKVLSEIGEVSDEIAKERTEELKNELGDLGVTLIGLALMKNEKVNTDLLNLGMTLKYIFYAINENLYRDDIYRAFENYKKLVYSLNLDILECATIAYNKIQARLENGQLKVINGTIQK